MAKRRLGRSDLMIEPLVLGTNVIGGTIDEPTSFAVLDAFLDEGFTAIDTADIYTKGNSETIIGNWVKARGNRDKVLIFTKIGAAEPQRRSATTAQSGSPRVSRTRCGGSRPTTSTSTRRIFPMGIHRRRKPSAPTTSS